jgi:hypothetical protein
MAVAENIDKALVRFSPQPQRPQNMPLRGRCGAMGRRSVLCATRCFLYVSRRQPCERVGSEGASRALERARSPTTSESLELALQVTRRSVAWECRLIVPRVRQQDPCAVALPPATDSNMQNRSVQAMSPTPSICGKQGRCFFNFKS